jgi:hypothetical protein
MQVMLGAGDEELLWDRQLRSDKRKRPCDLRQLHLSLHQRLCRQCGGLCLGFLRPWSISPLFQTLRGYKERGRHGLIYFLLRREAWWAWGE